MDNKQMIPVNEESFIYKIKQFFRSLKNILHRNKNDEQSNNVESFDNLAQNLNNEDGNEQEEIQINTTILATPETIRDRISNNIGNNTFDIEDVENQKKEFVEQFENNVEKLRLLSMDRLIKLEEYYDNIIKENQEIIESYE